MATRLRARVPIPGEPLAFGRAFPGLGPLPSSPGTAHARAPYGLQGAKGAGLTLRCIFGDDPSVGMTWAWDSRRASCTLPIPGHLLRPDEYAQKLRREYGG